MPLVAMPGSVMQNYGSAQHNTLCGKIITMTRPSNGVTEQAAIADTNISDTDSIDMTSDLWVDFGQPANDGSIISALNWSIGGTSSGGGGGTCTETYTVVSGDYCYKIWTEFGITQAELQSWNPSLDSACDLSIGQVLCVAEGSSSGGTCKQTYTVVSGDYCYEIWTKYGITQAQLMSWNPSLDSACDLSIGQVLCVSE